ncbi:hypothetical protein EES41_38470 (plasmid) [Streptomyces sp. ADI95-16]|nr:hypothetical protein EES41_38470 [Streptomyces sp. ADI95-16]
MYSSDNCPSVAMGHDGGMSGNLQSFHYLRTLRASKVRNRLCFRMDCVNNTTIMNEYRSGPSQHIVRVLAAPPLAAFMQVGRGFGVRRSPWLCA